MHTLQVQETRDHVLGQTIGEFSQRFGVSLRTLRFYEGAGLLDPVRVGTNRYFGPRDAVRMELTIKGKRLGLSLREIKELIDAHVQKNSTEPAAITDALDGGRMAAQLAILEKQKASLEAAIQQLRAASQFIAK